MRPAMRLDHFPAQGLTDIRMQLDPLNRLETDQQGAARRDAGREMAVAKSLKLTGIFRDFS